MKTVFEFYVRGRRQVINPETGQPKTEKKVFSDQIDVTYLNHSEAVLAAKRCNDDLLAKKKEWESEGL